MLDFEVNHTGTYVFGFEESYGCLIGTHARDKDAIVASWLYVKQQLITRQRECLFGIR